MSKNTSIALDEHFQKFVQEQVAQGRYGSTSEVIRASLKLLEEHDTKLTHGQQTTPILSGCYGAISPNSRK